MCAEVKRSLFRVLMGSGSGLKFSVKEAVKSIKLFSSRSIRKDVCLVNYATITWHITATLI